MFVHRDCSMAAQVRRQLTELELEIERPIRVLYGRARGNYLVPAWHHTHFEGDDFQFATENGITLVHYGSLHDVVYNTIRYPGGLGLFVDGNRLERVGAGINFYDALTMPVESGDWVADPLTLGEEPDVFPVGEIGERVVLFNYQHLSYDQLNFDAVVRPAIMASLDEDRAASFKARVSDLVRQRFSAYARRTSDVGLDDLRKEVGKLMRDYDAHMRQAATTRVDLRGKQKMLDALMANDNGGTEAKLLEMWAMMLDDERIEDVTFNTANQLVITTGPMFLTHPHSGVEVYLGKMRWSISIENQLCTVQNLDNARGGYDHPHVYMNNPCFGELGTTIYTLLKQGQVYPAVEMIFAFLKSINYEDDWGRRAAFWFDDPMDSPRNLTDDEPEPVAVIEDVTDDLELAEPVPA